MGLDVRHLLEVLAVFTTVAAAIELVNYLIIYRTAVWKSACADLKAAGKEWERLLSSSAAPGASTVNTKTKGEKKVEARMMTASREIYRLTMVTNVTSALAGLLGLYVITKAYEGKVVATLPFEPYQWMRKVLQRGLPEGDNGNGCSSHFVGVLVTVAVRPNLQRLMGFAPSRALAKMSQRGFEQFASKVVGLKSD